MALTPKQAAFVDAYLDSFNLTKAAKVAGYQGDDKSLASIGWENFRKLEISEAIKQRLSEKAMSADEVLARLADIGRGDISDFLDIKDGIKTPFIDISKAAAAGKLHLIKKLKLTQDNGIEFELHDPITALTLIGKAHKLFVERHDNSVTHDISDGAKEILLSKLGDIADRISDGFNTDDGV